MEPNELKMVIVVRRDLNMRKGKIGAQCGHASLGFVIEAMRSPRGGSLRFDDTDERWLLNGQAKVVVGCDSLEELETIMGKARTLRISVHKVTDSGRTEFHGVPTVTCAAFGPARSDVLDIITGHLRLM